MAGYDDLILETLSRVKEIMPWDLSRTIDEGGKPLLLDVREPAEFAMLRIPGSLNVPRGVLEQSCEWDYDETEPLLASRRDQDIVVICRSGRRSVLAADMLLRMGYEKVASLKTGVRGWNDFEQPLEDAEGKLLDADLVDALLAPRLRADQRKPKV
jgi:rhodanese-related sulfurtransferase